MISVQTACGALAPLEVAVLAAALQLRQPGGSTFSAEDILRVLEAECISVESTMEDVRRFLCRRSLEFLLVEWLTSDDGVHA